MTIVEIPFDFAEWGYKSTLPIADETFHCTALDKLVRVIRWSDGYTIVRFA